MVKSSNGGLDTFGKRLKFARMNHANISQGELASRLGLQQAYISQLETGNKQTTTHVMALADALGIEVRWLMSGNGNMVNIELTGPFQKLIKAAEKYSLSEDEIRQVEEKALKEIQEIFLSK